MIESTIILKGQHENKVVIFYLYMCRCQRRLVFFWCVLKDERIASERQKTGVCRDSVLKEYIPVSHT